jgi:hypothetical protein
MKTLSIRISEHDFNRLGFESSDLEWEALIKKIKAELAKEALQKSKSLAKLTGLSELTLEEINAEINAVRNAKTGH